MQDRTGTQRRRMLGVLIASAGVMTAGAFAQNKNVTIKEAAGAKGMVHSGMEREAAAPAANQNLAIDGTFALHAATANPTTTPEVRLRWRITSGWLPEGGGFNLYRTAGQGADAGKRVKINTDLIRPDENRVSTIKFSPKLESRLLLTTARQSLAGVRQVELFRMNEAVKAPISAAPVVAARRTRILELRQAGGPALAPSEFQQKVAEHPQVRDYLMKVKGIAPNGTMMQKMQMPRFSQAVMAQPAMLQKAADINKARTLVHIGALTNQEFGKAMGLAYDDKQGIALNATYKYALVLVVGGKETEVATADITVGKDPQPPAPQNLTATQLGADTVGLHWERLTDEQGKIFGFGSYYIKRTDMAHPQPLALNDKPLLQSVLPGTQMGESHDPLDTFRDEAAPTGQATYTVVMRDIFGRESPPTSVQVDLPDIHTPKPPINADARLAGNNVTIEWMVFNEKDVFYRIYRVDMEQKDAKPVPVLPNNEAIPGQFSPIPGGANVRSMRAYQDANVPSDHVYRYYVTSVYTKNKLDSEAAIAKPVAVPLLTPPTIPGAITADPFKKADAAADAKVSAKPTAEAGGTTQIKNQALQGKSLGQLFGKEYRDRVRAQIDPGILRLLVPLDYGGEVTLHWAAPANGGQPMTYRIYRANATGFWTVANAQPAPVPDAAPNGTPNAENADPQIKAPLLQNKLFQRKELFAPKAGNEIVGIQSKNLRYFDRIPIQFLRPEFKMIATTKTNQYSDEITKSQSHNYIYAVEPVNRWGVVGPRVELEVHVPPTLPPSVPALTMVHPNQDNRNWVDVDIHANISQEDVTIYHVYRKEVPTRRTVYQAANVILEKDSAIKSVLTGSERFGVRPKDTIIHELRKVATPHPTASAQGGIALQKSDRLELATQTKYLTLFNDLAGYTEITPALTVADPGKASLVSFTDKTAIPEVEYAYKVVAENVTGFRSAASEFMEGRSHRVEAAAPTNVTVTSNATGVVLTWGAATEAVGYIVMRSSDVGADAKFIQLGGLVVNKTTYTDYSAFPGRTYQYQVMAVDKAGLSSKPVAAAGNPYKVPAK